jgi:hypothetical protein
MQVGHERNTDRVRDLFSFNGVFSDQKPAVKSENSQYYEGKDNGKCNHTPARNEVCFTVHCTASFCF